MTSKQRGGGSMTKIGCVHTVCGSECELISTGSESVDCNWWICRTCQTGDENQSPYEYMIEFDSIETDLHPDDVIWQVREIPE